MPLKAVFEQFRKSKAALENIHKDTIKYFEEIDLELSGPRDAEIAKELTLASSPTAFAHDPEETLAISDIRFDFERASLTDLLYSAQERDEVNSLFSAEEPALIFVGQTNCGKSSIINELLGCKALPTSDQPSTARIVRVSYAEEPFCRLVAKNGTILQVSDSITILSLQRCLTPFCLTH